MKVIFYAGYTHMDVLIKARNMVHEGWVLDYDPLANRMELETNPYFSVILDEKYEKVCSQSVKLVEAVYRVFKKRPVRLEYNERVKSDFQFMDKNLIDLLIQFE